MKKNWLIIAVIGLVLILVGLIVKNKFFTKPGPGALRITTTPKATVFVDGVQVGTTLFFDDKIKSGEHTVKLVPEATNDSLVGWEGKVSLAPGILTAINRNFGASEASSSGDILSLEKISSRDKSSLAVVSVPDQTVVKVNGEPKGFSPVLVENLTPGDYQVTVVSPGYEERTISAKTVAGYKLIINVQLAQKIEGIVEATSSAEITVKATPSPKVTPRVTPTPKVGVNPPEKPYVRIKETPTGFLRVRESSGSDSVELARVNPGETYPYLNEEKSGWYKIEYKTGKEGWVSGVYVELVK